AIALLGAETLRLDHQHAIGGHPAVALAQQARARGLVERRRVGHVKAQLNRRRHLVDVLPARSAGTNEAFDDLVVGYLDLHLPVRAPSSAAAPTLGFPLDSRMNEM